MIRYRTPAAWAGGLRSHIPSYDYQPSLAWRTRTAITGRRRTPRLEALTKLNGCLTEGRKALSIRPPEIEGGIECANLASLLSALADGDASGDEELAGLRYHLGSALYALEAPWLRERGGRRRAAPQQQGPPDHR